MVVYNLVNTVYISFSCTHTHVYTLTYTYIAITHTHIVAVSHLHRQGCYLYQEAFILNCYGFQLWPIDI